MPGANGAGAAKPSLKGRRKAKTGAKRGKAPRAAAKKRSAKARKRR